MVFSPLFKLPRTQASLWEGGGPKGRRERTLPLSEALSPIRFASPLPEGAKSAGDEPLL